MSLFATNDELFAKLKAGNPGFDVIVPSNEFVTRMGQAGLLEVLDHAKIPNMKNIDPAFMNPDYDPGRKYSMPYTWLVLGIGYRKSKVKGVPDSWKYLFDSNQYAGKIALLSESADLIRLAAKYKGHSVNNIPPDTGQGDRGDADQAEAVRQSVPRRQRPGHAGLGRGRPGARIQRRHRPADEGRRGRRLRGAQGRQLINSDTLCIPKGAPRPLNAHKFINYLLDAEAGATISKTILYPTPNAAAKALMPDSYKNNPVIFPSPAVMAKCEYGAFEGAEKAS
jgi:spermidine/putrescine transport system substrate-binding protein